MPSQFSQAALQKYMAYVTSMWFGRHDMPPDDLEEYAPYIEDMRRYVAKKNDLDGFKQVLEYALLTPDFDYEPYEGGQYTFESEEVRDIMAHVYRTLWPGAELPLKAPAVELTAMPASEWWALCAEQTP